MARARKRLVGLVPALALAASVVPLGVIGCGSPSVDEDLAVGLPDRVVPEAVVEGGRDGASPPDVDAAPPPKDAGADTSAATQAALLCGASDLALCFAFEGAVEDHSPSALKPTVSGVSFAPGVTGQAALFNAASFVRFAASPSLELTTATIEAWVKLAPNPTGDGVIFDDDNRASLTILANGTVLCKPNGAAINAKVVVDQWTHVACVFDGANAHLYVSGFAVGSGPGVIGSSPTSTAAVGGNAPSGEPFVGAIDSLRVFRVARTPAQIAAAAGK